MFFEGLHTYRAQFYDGGTHHRSYKGVDAQFEGEVTMVLGGLLGLVGVYCLGCGLLRRPDFAPSKPKNDIWN